jgi:diguanylate cyclase (GGDEF)-like protein
MLKIPKDIGKKAPKGKQVQAAGAFSLALGRFSSPKEIEEYLGHFAKFDLLTELPNRSQFHDRLEGALARATRHGQLVGLMLLNLDSFRRINTKFGHRMGDRVLKSAAERLKACTRKSDTLARIGGDEFAILLEGLATKELAAEPARRALHALSRPLVIDDKEIMLSATAGVAVYPVDVADTDGLLRAADFAMCDAKDRAPNTFCLYSSEIELKTRRELSRRTDIEANLAKLTPRELEVLDILVEGKANKMIAYMLGTSTRTIENHRASIMRKMQADSLAALVRMVLDHRGSVVPAAG